MIAEFIDPAILGFILVGVMLFAIFVGFPISFTLIFLGFVFGYLGFGKLVFYLMTLQFSMVMTEQTLAAVPLFVFMGHIKGIHVVSIPLSPLLIDSSTNPIVI